MSSRITMTEQPQPPAAPQGFMMLPMGPAAAGSDYQTLMLYQMYCQALEQSQRAAQSARRVPDLFANMN